jgi:hypothetical protein
MSGILERIEAKLDQLLAQAGTHAQPAQPAPLYTYAQPVHQPVQTYAQPVQQPAAPASITADQLTALVVPHIDNPAIKDAFSTTMKQAGVNSLAEARPDQYPDLYARFQAVISQFAAAPAPAPAAMSLI